MGLIVESKNGIKTLSTGEISIREKKWWNKAIFC
jgi:hypothetical protein